MSIDHWMLFATFAQQHYFEYPDPGTYAGVIINANMAAHAPAGLAAFLLEKTAGSTYIIDPLTHAFQHDPEVVSNRKGEPKPSVKSLAEQYGQPVVSLFGKGPLLPEHLEDTAVLEHFVERCLTYQCSELATYMGESDAAKYLDKQETEVPPYAVVAPYFYMTEVTIDDWLPVNIAAAKHAARVAASKPSKVFASVVISKGILVDEERRKAITGAFKNIALDGFLLWIDDLNELAASKMELKALLDFTHALRAGGDREVINLHGGYFSVLAAGVLGKSALSGVTHGPEFGEFRSVIPVGGGIPIARYYVPKLHARIRYREALNIFRAKRWLESAEAFHANVCDLPECKATLSGDAANFVRFGESSLKNIKRRGGIVRIAFPTKAAKEHCLKHYLQRKKWEFAAAAGADARPLLAELRNGYKEYKDVAGLEGVGHLRLWETVFEEEQQ